MKPAILALTVLALFLASCQSSSSRHVDAGIESEIAKIKAIDNHAHPMRVFSDGEKDSEYDALPVEAMEPAPSPVRLRDRNLEYTGAWRKLFGYRFDDMTELHIHDAIEAKKKTMRDKGDRYSTWVLDQLGIETMLANRMYMGRGLTAPRFRWVPFVDAFMYPLNNESIAKQNPDYKAFYPAEEKLLKRYLAESGFSGMPNTFDDYLAKLVTPTLERMKQNGAVAVKFEAAYLRSLDFADPLKVDADRIYSIYSRSAEPTAEEYKTVQDYIFRYLARECGRLRLPVHLHVMAGAGGYFKVAGANPLLLEPLLNDPSLRKTNFVLVHGGWPFTREVAALLGKANTYADFSAQSFILYPVALASVIREWLEFMPEKVLFATDASPFTAELGWEETGWLSAATGRRALGVALTGMMRDGEITRDRANELARMVLRENAMKLYGFK